MILYIVEVFCLHTASKEKAFQHIASFLKKGGYLIFGDPNKAGGFQNMLQRYAVYKFANTPDEMVDVCERRLFKDDIIKVKKQLKELEELLFLTGGSYRAKTILQSLRS